jgi:hypothetical protein
MLPCTVPIVFARQEAKNLVRRIFKVLSDGFVLLAVQ